MAKSSKDTQLIELKDTISELNKLIKSLQETIDSLQKRLDDTALDRENYKEQVEYLKKKLFGPSSKNRDHNMIDGQITFFDKIENKADIEHAVKEAETIAEDLNNISKAKKKRSTNLERFKGVPVKRIELEPDSKICPDCGSEMERIGEEFV